MGRAAVFVNAWIALLAMGCDSATPLAPDVGSAGTGAATFRWIEPTERVASLAAYVRTEGFPSATGSVVVGTSTALDDVWRSRVVEGFVWTEATGTLGLGGLPDVDADAVSFLSKPLAVTPDGSVVVGQAITPQFDGVAFRWTREEGIEVLIGGFAKAEAVSDDGTVVIGRQMSPLPRAFRWTREAGAVELDLAPGAQTEPLYLSPDGRTVLARSTQLGASQLFRWTEEAGAQAIEPAEGLRSCDQTGPSSSLSYGPVAGGRCINANDQAEPFVWTEQQGMIGLGTIDRHDVHLFAISEDGSVAVGVAEQQVDVPDLRPTRWTQAKGMEFIALPAGYQSGTLVASRSTMSADGSVAVGAMRGSAGVGSFRWSEIAGSIALLPLEGHSTTEVHALSADGSVAVGISYRPTEGGPRSFETAVFWHADGVAHRVTERLVMPMAGGLLQAAEHMPSPQSLVGRGLESSGQLLWHARFLNGL